MNSKREQMGCFFDIRAPRVSCRNPETVNLQACRIINGYDSMICCNFARIAAIWSADAPFSYRYAISLPFSRVARRKVEGFSGKRIEWIRVAITEEQFERMRDQFGNRAKAKDKLKPAYIEKYHTDQCVEVDAIPSDDVRDLLEKAIVKRIDTAMGAITND